MTSCIKKFFLEYLLRKLLFRERKHFKIWSFPFLFLPVCLFYWVLVHIRSWSEVWWGWTCWGKGEGRRNALVKESRLKLWGLYWISALYFERRGDEWAKSSEKISRACVACFTNRNVCPSCSNTKMPLIIKLIKRQRENDYYCNCCW